MFRDEATLIDIISSARLVKLFVAGLTKEQFLGDIKTQSAVLYQPLVMGEAVKRLSREFRSLHPEVPWQLIAGMRDHLIHGYDVIDWEEIWKTATRDVPDLLTQIEHLYPEESGQSL